MHNLIPGPSLPQFLSGGDRDTRGKRSARSDDAHQPEYQDEPGSCVKVVVDENQTNNSDSVPR